MCKSIFLYSVFVSLINQPPVNKIYQRFLYFLLAVYYNTISSGTQITLGRTVMDMIKIGENIKAKRRERELTQEELANMLSVTKAAVSKWENTESYPDITMLPKIAQLFHITMDELFGYTLEYKPLKIVTKYSAGFAFFDIEDCNIFDHVTIEESSIQKVGRAVGDEWKYDWEVRVDVTSTEDDFPYIVQKCIKPGLLVDLSSIRLADGKIMDDDRPNKHFICKDKIWEYRTEDIKYINQMLKEQVAMGLIEDPY